ncbi:MAG: AbrB/MazE/SpoVT family DNA-binding domain-containing protein [Nanoarchaeota archaeon]|nr:AbrB/MazE/SpoVT family DNA-binding domain-containing protein [Nanoarchaeota archaeon]MBU1134888.1 AbrB/MazE/SpoVT family DNA-binding domain-containing protein [Nanoarchaeota archaeon]MBU2520398.1 AbrB/MazE/SpoVT family DNA-binding domain-containing protein [Nanoarchaeota archaeon]
MPELTKISSKGQVVIPSGIRHELGIKTGMQLVVSRMDDFVLLKRITIPDPKAEFKELTELGKRFAGKKGVKNEDDVIKIIHKSRGVKSD